MQESRREDMRPGKRGHLFTMRCLLCCATILGAPAAVLAQTQPGGAAGQPFVVAAGQIESFSTQNVAGGTVRTITQSTPRAVLDWQDLSVTTGSTLAFVQPDAQSITLNRVTGQAASVIDGSLSANGQIWILNPNGLLVAPTGLISTAGFLATTAGLSLSPEAFVDSATQTFPFSDASSATLENRGLIDSPGGYVVLAGQSVANMASMLHPDTLIRASLGKVALGSGRAFTVDFAGDGLLSFAVDMPADIGTGIVNSGAIIAQGGTVLLQARTAQAVLSQVINTTGVIEATSVTEHGGHITLDAGQGGFGGLMLAGTVEADSANGTAGSIHLIGADIAIGDEGAPTVLSVDGLGGGSIRATAFMPLDAAVPGSGVRTGTNALLSARGSGAGGGGIINLDASAGIAGAITVAGRLQASATNSLGGNIQLVGSTVSIGADGADATIDAAGRSGGAILVNAFASPSSLLPSGTITIGVNANLSVRSGSGSGGYIGLDAGFGGFGSIDLNGSLDAGSDSQAGGGINLVASDISVGEDGSPGLLDASGLVSGGQLVLSAFAPTGGEPVPVRISIGSNAILRANALENGPGGSILVFGQGIFGGSVTLTGVLEANGGQQDGAGGYIYLNSPMLDLVGLRASATSLSGSSPGGQFVAQAAGFALTSPFSSPGFVVPGANVATSSLEASLVSNMLTGGTNVVLLAGSAGGDSMAGGAGSDSTITVSNPIVKTGSRQAYLELVAAGDISVQAQIVGEAGLSMFLRPDADSDGEGRIVLSGRLDTGAAIVPLPSPEPASANGETPQYSEATPPYPHAGGSLIALQGDLLLAGDATLASAGSILFEGRVDSSLAGQHALVVEAADGAVAFGQAVGSLAAPGAINLHASMFSAVDIAAGTGQVALRIEANGLIDGEVSVGSLQKSGAGRLRLLSAGSSIDTIGLEAGELIVRDESALGGSAVTLAGGTLRFEPMSDLILTGPYDLTGDSSIEIDTPGNVDFQSSIDGAHRLEIATTGNLRLSGTLGAEQRLLSLDVLAEGTVTIGETVRIEAEQDIRIGTLGGFSNESTASDVLSSTSGRWLVWSGNPDALDPQVGDRTGLLAHDFRLYGISPEQVRGLAPLPALPAGNGLVYSLAPVLTVAAGSRISKVYDGTANLQGPLPLSATGAIGGDIVTVEASAATFSSPNAGTNQVLLSGISVTASDEDGQPVFGYRLEQQDLTAIGSILPRPLVVSLTGTIERIYDGTVDAQLAPANFAVNGLVSGETITVAATAGSYAGKDVGSDLLVTTTLSPSAFTAGGGALVSNYVLPGSASGPIGSILPRMLVYVADPAQRLLGQPNPPLTGTVTGFIAGEGVGNATSGTVEFTSPATLDSPVGSYPVTGGGLFAVNYIFEQAQGNATALSVTGGTLQTIVAETLAIASSPSPVVPLEPLPDDSTSISPDGKSGEVTPARQPEVPPFAPAPDNDVFEQDSNASLIMPGLAVTVIPVEPVDPTPPSPVPREPAPTPADVEDQNDPVLQLANQNEPAPQVREARGTIRLSPEVSIDLSADASGQLPDDSQPASMDVFLTV